MSVWVVIVLLGVLALAGAPLFTIIGAIGLIAFTSSGTDTAAMIAELYRLVDLPALIAIPLFTFAGFLLAESQAPRRLIRLAGSLFGWMPGGLAVVALFSTAIFTAGNTPVCPTMSPLAKLTRMKRYLSAAMAARRASVISAAFIHGRCSKGRMSAR